MAPSSVAAEVEAVTADLSIKDLQRELKNRELRATGTENELKDRLEKAMSIEVAQQRVAAAEANASTGVEPLAAVVAAPVEAPLPQRCTPQQMQQMFDEQNKGLADLSAEMHKNYSDLFAGMLSAHKTQRWMFYNSFGKDPSTNPLDQA